MFAVFSKDRLKIGAFWVNPEFNHTAWRMIAAWNKASFLPLADIADIYDNKVRVIQLCDQVCCLNFINACAGITDHFCSC